MPRTDALLLWFVAATSVLTCGQVQRPDFADPGALPFILRMEHTRSANDVCAIVRGDGLFHLEKETSIRTEIEEGILEDGELAALKTLLSNQELASLTQHKIQVPLILGDRDVLQVSILRSPVTQNLTFTDREARRPFDDFIDPLLHWMDLLPKHSHATLDEYNGRNHCLPPHQLKFSARRPEAPPKEPPVPPTLASRSRVPEGLASETPTQKSAAPSFLMRWQFNHIGNGAVEDTCIVVAPSGAFRWERSNQGYNEKLRVRVFEDSLDQAEIAGLQVLLDDPTLRSATHQNSPSGRIFREGEITTLSVARDGTVQQLTFANYFGIPGFVSNVNAGTDPEERIVKPLRKWLKSHIEGKKLKAIPDTVATHCITAPESSHP